MTSSNGNIFPVTGHLCAGNSPRKDQWRGALMFSLICVWINGWVNNREAGDLKHYRAHYDVIVMTSRGPGGYCQDNIIAYDSECAWPSTFWVIRYMKYRSWNTSSIATATNYMFPYLRISYFRGQRCALNSFCKYSVNVNGKYRSCVSYNNYIHT